MLSLARALALVASLLLVATLVHASANDGIVLTTSQVVTLTDANFDHLVKPTTGDNGDWIVEFYAPWCGHCKSLEPVWNTLAETITTPNLRVAKLDATTELAQSKRFDIRGFPSIRLFSRGRMYEFKGSRGLETLRDFAQGRGAGLESKGIPDPPTHVELVLEHLGALGGDVQNVLVRSTMAGCVLFGAGLLVGALAALLIYASCMEKGPAVWVRFKDPVSGQMKTVPFVKPDAKAVAAAVAAAQAAAASSPSPSPTSAGSLSPSPSPAGSSSPVIVDKEEATCKEPAVSAASSSEGLKSRASGSNKKNRKAE